MITETTYRISDLHHGICHRCGEESHELVYDDNGDDVCIDCLMAEILQPDNERNMKEKERNMKEKDLEHIWNYVCHDLDHAVITRQNLSWIIDTAYESGRFSARAEAAAEEEASAPLSASAEAEAEGKAAGRLQIAATTMQAILSNSKMSRNLCAGENTVEGAVACIVKAALMYTDALITAECASSAKTKKGGDK